MVITTLAREKFKERQENTVHKQQKSRTGHSEKITKSRLLGTFKSSFKNRNTHLKAHLTLLKSS